MINKDNSISSKIVISCKREGPRTYLEDSYFDMPYKVVHYGSKLLQEHLEVMLMCYSPGVMDGDSLDISVHCPTDSEMRLFTQSFNKLHPMKKGARQFTKVQVDRNAIFQFLPQPSIPFKQSIFDTENVLELDSAAHLIWGDIISGGRIHSGERFEFTKIHSRTKVIRDGKLIFFDNQLMEPGKQPVEKMLFFEGHTHQGTLLIVSEFAKQFKAELDEVLTEQFIDMSYGYTMSGENTLLIRALGESGEAMHDWLANIGEMCWSFIKHHSPDPGETANLSKQAVKKTGKKPATKTVIKELKALPQPATKIKAGKKPTEPKRKTTRGKTASIKK